MRTKFLLLSAITFIGVPFSAAQADEDLSPWLVRVGYANASFDTSATLKLAETQVPGAVLDVPSKSLPLGEIGYELTDRWTARLAIGPPPTVTVLAGGSLKQYSPPLSGVIGKLTIAPIILSATYSLGDFSGLKPYIGAGISYTIVIDTKDADIVNIHAKNAWGSALQLGTDWVVDRHWSVFLDARKVFLKTTGTGTVTALGSAAAWGEASLDPLIVTAGVAYHF